MADKQTTPRKRGGNAKKDPAARRARPKAEGDGRSVLERPLDALGLGNAEVVAEVLASLDEQRKRLDSLQVVEDLGDNDPVPGMPPGRHGEIVTFASRRRAINEGKDRLLAANEPIREDIKRVVKARERANRERLKQLAGDEEEK